MATENNPFGFLNGLLNVLVIDPDASVKVRLYDPLFMQIPCCSVRYVTSNTEALQTLKSGKRFHVCITELAINDVEDDPFYILRHYSSHSSIAVVTSHTSAAAGAEAVHLGARAVFDKGDNFDREHFFHTFRRMALINVINCRFNECLGDTLTGATRTLFEKQPSTVTEWADYMKITDRQLRNLWHSGSGFGAKQMLFLHDCLSAALTFYGRNVCGDGVTTPSIERLFKKQYALYFSTHREVLLFILS